MCLSTLLVLPVTIHLAYITAPVIKTDDTIIANNKNSTKDNKASTRWQSKTTQGPREDGGTTDVRPTITAGLWLSEKFFLRDAAGSAERAR